MDNLLQFVFDLIFKPGSSLTLIPAINGTVVILLGVLIYLSYTKIAAIHLIIMGTLSLGLLASVNWLVIFLHLFLLFLYYLIFILGFIMNLKELKH